MHDYIKDLQYCSKKIFKISIRNKQFVFVISTTKTITISISIFIKTPLITITKNIINIIFYVYYNFFVAKLIPIELDENNIIICIYKYNKLRYHYCNLQRYEKGFQ